MAQESVNPKKVGLVIGLVILGIFLLVFGGRMMVTINGGHGGVLFRTFGGGIDVDHPYGEGFHFISPFNNMAIYDVRQHEVAEEMNVLSSAGLEISADVSAWYQPVFNKLGVLHAEIGPDYLRKIIIPSLRSSARLVIGRYTPEQIYSTKRDVIEEEIFIETKNLLDKKNVQLNQVLIRSIILPGTIKKAIESKLQQEQLSLEYEFKLDKATKEAERQRIEAEGKAAANLIIHASLTERILREKGIIATLKLAESSNTKVVVIGNTKDGLPLILGDSK
ncbi:MAG: prohibitin family protein [Bacteroidales bacterium]|nr:prohibitin family protein [Bacteroidales bacterium]